MALSPEFRQQRARVAALARHHPEQVEPRRTMKAEAAERYVRELVNGHPALDLEQRVRLARLLLPGGDA